MRSAASNIHQLHMKTALELARRGEGMVSPNPLVGAVLVKNGQVIGRGFHEKYGQDHAEIVALKDARQKGWDAKNSTLYTTLEPCCHTDKQTPPCVKAIIDGQIKEVVIASKDCNPRVNGEGIRELRQANIPVIEGVNTLAEAAINRIYRKFIKTKLPYVHLKIVQTLDGKIATNSGDSRWISDEIARSKVHKWRFRYDGILVGRNTVNVDNPKLDIRLVDSKGKIPWRIVLGDPQKMNMDAKVFCDEFTHKTIILTSSDRWQEDISLKKLINDRKIIVLAKKTLAEKLQAIGQMRMASLFVEGGERVFSSFIKENLYDRLSVVIAPKLLGDGKNSFHGFNAKYMKDALEFKEGAFTSLGNQVVFDFKRE